MLNDEQKLAAQHVESHSLLLAGPGTGKTTTLIGRYQYLLATGTNAQRVLVCTFSKRAADELKSRINKVVESPASKLPIGTFHSLSVRILRNIGEVVGVANDFNIWVKDWERRKVLKALKDAMVSKGEFCDDLIVEVESEDVLQIIDDWREALLDPEDASVQASERGDKVGVFIADLYLLYEDYLNTENKIDFPRMVQWACKALKRDSENGGVFGKQFSDVLVDEFQDINFAQKTLIDLLVSTGARLWAVGDDFQAIYGWRGGNVKYLLRFKKQYEGAKIFTLTQNYRSGKLIVELCNNLSQHLKEKYEKELIAVRPDKGEIIFDHLHDEKNEALAIADEVQARIKAGVPLSEIAVLARTNRLPAIVVTTLIKRGIPLNLKGGVSVFTDYESRLFLTAVAVSSEQKTENIWGFRINPGLYSFSKRLVGDDWVKRVKALATYIINRPPNGLSDEELEARQEALERDRDYVLGFDDAKSLFDLLKAVLDAKETGQKVFVGTIHSAKGLEWDSVCVIGWEDSVMPQRRDISFRAYEEERRVAYVGITRAKNFLMLTFARERWADSNFDYSPFLEEMFGAELIDGELKTVGGQTEHSAPVPPKGETSERHSSFDPIFESSIEKIKRLKALRLEKEAEEDELRKLTPVADGAGEGTGWAVVGSSKGLLLDVGYTVKKDGPRAKDRQEILANVFHGQVNVPDWMSETVQEQWGEPNSEERFNKIRNTLNVALGTQKGRNEPSIQAVEKWEKDLAFLDTELRSSS